MIIKKAISDEDFDEMFSAERIRAIYKLANKNGGFDEVWQISPIESRRLILRKLKSKIRD